MDRNIEPIRTADEIERFLAFTNPIIGVDMSDPYMRELYGTDFLAREIAEGRRTGFMVRDGDAIVAGALAKILTLRDKLDRRIQDPRTRRARARCGNRARESALAPCRVRTRLRRHAPPPRLPWHPRRLPHPEEGPLVGTGRLFCSKPNSIQTRNAVSSNSRTLALGDPFVTRYKSCAQGVPMPVKKSLPQCPSNVVDDEDVEDVTGLTSPPPGRCPSDIVYEEPENVSGLSESPSSRCPSDIGDGDDGGSWGPNDGGY